MRFDRYWTDLTDTETMAENWRNFPKARSSMFLTQKLKLQPLLFASLHCLLPSHWRGRLSVGTTLTFTKPGRYKCPSDAFSRSSSQSLGCHQIPHSFSRLLSPPSHLFLLHSVSKESHYYTWSFKSWSSKMFEKNHYQKHRNKQTKNPKTLIFQKRSNVPVWKFPSYPEKEMRVNEV